ncbi:MAG: alpha-amylase family glycosyl hydrolase [Bacteroidales bacterium]
MTIIFGTKQKKKHPFIMHKMKHLTILAVALIIATYTFSLTGCSNPTNPPESNREKEKPVAWSEDAAIYEVNIRQYTPEGTFNAFREHLPRLKEMGTEILWLMPIHPIGEKNRKGKLGSYYAVKDYLGVNPNFGTEEDFRALVDEVHKLDMYIIIDWVANHTAWDNALIEEHPDWYTRNEEGEVIAPVEDWSDVADLNYNNAEVHDYMVNALKYWVEEFNIDGYRCDVAGMVPTEFWNRARLALDSIKPVFMLAEANDPELHRAFDMTYAWDLHFIFNEVAQGKKEAAHIVTKLREGQEKYPENAYRMLFTSNHDENSWKGDVYDRLGEAVPTFAALTVALPGMPLIYSGQEACLDKSLAFFEKDSIAWKKCDMFELYKTLLHAKKSNPALWNGAHGGQIQLITPEEEPNLLIFTREKGKNKILAMFNLSDEPQSYHIPEELKVRGFKKIVADKKLKREGKLAPWEFMLFSK